MFALASQIQLAAAQQEIDNIEDRLPPSTGADNRAGEDSIEFPGELLGLDAAAADVENAAVEGFVLTAVDITGATVFPPEAFAPLYDGLLARHVTLKDVAALVEAVTQLYRDNGYFLSRAVAPAQDAAGGVLRIRVAEGYLSEVRLDGDADKTVQARLDRLKHERPLRLSTLERALALTGDLKGVKVKASRIEPDPDSLALHRLVVVIEKDAFEASLYADNRGTEDGGPLQAYARAAANSVLTTGDQISGGVFLTPADPGELVLGELNYQVPLGGAGTTATVSGMMSHFDAGGPRAATETESRTRRIGFNIRHSLIRRRKLTLWASTGFEWRNFEEERLGVRRFEDKLRTIFAAAEFRTAHFDGVTAVSGRATQGLAALDASTTGALSRPDANGQFTKFNLEVSRFQNLGADFGVYASVAGQYAIDPLLASEEFSLGGARYGRAYDYGEFRGDDGVASSIELRYGRKSSLDVLKSYQVYGFYDIGTVWNDNVIERFRELNLSSAGAGLRLTLPEDIYLNAEIAKPLDGAPVNQGDQSWRGFFYMSKRF